MSKLAEAKELIRELAELLQQSELSEIEVEEDGLRIRVARQLTVTAQLPPPALQPASATGAAPVSETIQPAAGQAGGPSEPPAQAASDAASEEEDWLSHPGLVTAPMVGTAYVAPEPGAKPFVQVGDTVEEGQTLLIIEAMKVMNPIPAPRAGTVRHIFFSDAQPVEYGEPLLVIA
ncbi:MAG: acetyl-CoA carboxylase biotin carboxyl carrier protein [Alphaproteobacteria bacterium]|nr:MAG: acetyl-CoA carboxylase biotin carboxyl carrier protein [Alphaproteobacteria bacterium]